jgi:hypothetical protein
MILIISYLAFFAFTLSLSFQEIILNFLSDHSCVHVYAQRNFVQRPQMCIDPDN